jgi:hypothetical protein
LLCAGDEFHRFLRTYMLNYSVTPTWLQHTCPRGRLRAPYRTDLGTIATSSGGASSVSFDNFVVKPDGTKRPRKADESVLLPDGTIDVSKITNKGKHNCGELCVCERHHARTSVAA